MWGGAGPGAAPVRGELMISAFRSLIPPFLSNQGPGEPENFPPRNFLSFLFFGKFLIEQADEFRLFLGGQMEILLFEGFLHNRYNFFNKVQVES